MPLPHDVAEVAMAVLIRLKDYSETCVFVFIGLFL